MRGWDIGGGGGIQTHVLPESHTPQKSNYNQFIVFTRYIEFDVPLQAEYRLAFVVNSVVNKVITKGIIV